MPYYIMISKYRVIIYKIFVFSVNNKVYTSGTEIGSFNDRGVCRGTLFFTSRVYYPLIRTLTGSNL